MTTDKRDASGIVMSFKTLSLAAMALGFLYAPASNANGDSTAGIKTDERGSAAITERHSGINDGGKSVASDIDGAVCCGHAHQGNLDKGGIAPTIEAPGHGQTHAGKGDNRGQLRTIDVPGARKTETYGINGHGKTVDIGDNGAAAFVATPTKAPEIDPASAASGLTLLLGSLMVLRARRPGKAHNDVGIR